MASEGGPQTQPVRRGVVDRIFGSWAGPRREMRRLLSDRPGEATLLSLLMIAALLGFMGRFADHAAQRWDPREPAFVAAWEAETRARIAENSEASVKDPSAWTAAERDRALSEAMSDKLTRDRFEMLIGSFLVFPLGLYLISAAAHPALRAAGGQGGGYETRAAFVWASVVAAPVGLAAQLLIVFAGPPDAVRAIVGVAVLAALLFFLANFLAEAHRFRSAASILGGVIGFFALASLILLAARAALF